MQPLRTSELHGKIPTNDHFEWSLSMHLLFCIELDEDFILFHYIRLFLVIYVDYISLSCHRTVYAHFVLSMSSSGCGTEGNWSKLEAYYFENNGADTRLIDLNRKSQNAPVPYPTMLHSMQKCTKLCSDWGIVGYGTGAFWVLWDWFITVCDIVEPV